MKATGSIKLLVISIFIFLISPVFAQETDDMYFSRSDRKAELKSNELVAKNTQQKVTDEPAKNPDQYGAIDQSYSTRNVNPEYIARYRDSKDAATDVSVDSSADNSYYVEDFNRNNTPTDKNGSITNNYYGNPYTPYSYYPSYGMYNMYGMNPYSSFYSPGWNFGMNYSFGYMPGWSMGFSYGNPWMYSSFYNPWSFGYDPWAYDYYSYNPYSPYLGFNSWYNPFSYGLYYNNYFYYSGYHRCWSCYYYGSGYDHHYASNAVYGRRTFRGSEGTTGTTALVNQGRQLRGATNTTTANNTTVNNAGRTRVSSQRDYSRIQNEYYATRQSNNPAYNRNTTNFDNRESMSRGTTRTYNPNNGNNYYNYNNSRSRVSPNTYDYSRPTYRTQSQRSTQSYYNNSYNNNRSYYSRPSTGSWNNSRSSGSYNYERSSGSSFSGRSSGSSFSGGGSRSSSGFSSGGSSSGSSSRGGGGRSH